MLALMVGSSAEGLLVNGYLLSKVQFKRQSLPRWNSWSAQAETLVGLATYNPVQCNASNLQLLAPVLPHDGLPQHETRAVWCENSWWPVPLLGSSKI